jgi:hypothetical protein
LSNKPSSQIKDKDYILTAINSTSEPEVRKPAETETEAAAVEESHNLKFALKCVLREIQIHARLLIQQQSL